MRAPAHLAFHHFILETTRQTLKLPGAASALKSALKLDDIDSESLNLHPRQLWAFQVEEVKSSWPACRKKRINLSSVKVRRACDSKKQTANRTQSRTREFDVPLSIPTASVLSKIMTKKYKKKKNQITNAKQHFQPLSMNPQQNISTNPFLHNIPLSSTKSPQTWKWSNIKSKNSAAELR